MKRSKQYQKGKHLYIKSGKKKKVYTLKESTPRGYDLEFDDGTEEIYVDQFKFDLSRKDFKIYFGRLLPGTGRIKLKRALLLDPRTAKRLGLTLENIFQSRKE
ncbi:MAG: hypothetical protein JW827_08910 [Spirochaetes bacterium]|nr:hypothetical protein [Spirochaetota bacterium]